MCPLSDGLGSVRQLADARGYVVQRYAYGPFGEPQAAEGSRTSRMRYTGEPWDGDVGLVYLRARWYDQAVGRFTQRDPFRGFSFFPQTQHPYVYCQNNSMKYTDPSGQIPLLLTAAIGAAIGGSVNATIQVAQTMYSDPNLTFQEAVNRIDVGQVVGAAAAGGFSGFGDLAKIGIDGGAGAISAGVGYGVSSHLGQWIYLPGGSSSAPAREIVQINTRLGFGVIRDLGTAPLLPVGATEQTLIYASDLTYEVVRGVFEEFLQTGVGGWAEDRIRP